MKYNTILKKTALGMLFVSSIVLGSCTDLDETLYSALPGDGSYNLQKQKLQLNMALSTTVYVICKMVGKDIWILVRSVVT